MEKATFKLQLLTNLVFKLAMTVPMPTMEFAVSATSSVPLVWEVPLTVFHALLTKSSIKEAAGLLVLPSFYQALELEALLVLTTVLTGSTKCPTPNVLHAPSNAQPAQLALTTVLHAFKDQSPSTEPAQLNVVKINSVSKEFVLPVKSHAMDAQLVLPTVKLALQDT